MDLNGALVVLQKDGWQIKMNTSKTAGCEFSFTAFKSGMGIGVFGVQGYGKTPMIAMKMLLDEVREAVKAKIKRDKEEEKKNAEKKTQVSNR